MSKEGTQVGIRVPKATRDAWVRAAEADGRTLSSWIVARCNGLPTTPPDLGGSETQPQARRRKPR